LFSLRNGTWTATWQPNNSAALTITLNAQARPSGAKGSATISGQLDANVRLPVVSAGGAINAASFDKDSPVTPGALIAVFGSSLADQVAAWPTLPFASELANTQALIGGLPMPLRYASPGQLIGIAPFDLSTGPQEIVVQHQGVLSIPETVDIGVAGPGVFTTSGTGQGAAVAFDDSTSRSVSPSTPVSPGEVVVIYCTGLGPVQPSGLPPGASSLQPEAGEAAPLSPAFAVTGDVSVTIGGLNANVLSAMITPGLAGVYQVSAVVPKGVRLGDAVRVTVTVNGVPSQAAVTIPIQ
jgi:uncharacterized protein (TIGR03437 family)